ncbi:MAG: hypothetical protein GXP42_10435 [Chloroflexi bacterium]|nr:hypothetical protein [Chloroflexota bacterium]
MSYVEKDVTSNEKYMEELKTVAGRFITPTLVIDGERLIGFGMNLPRVRELLQKGGYLD